MNGKELLEGFSRVDGTLVDEAEWEKTPSKLVVTASRMKWAATAACLGLVLLAAFGVLPTLFKNGDAMPPSDETDFFAGVEENEGKGTTDGATGSSHTDMTDEISVLTLSMDSIYVNDLSQASPEASRVYMDPELYDAVSWSREEVLAYYGRDLNPAYIPAGLTAAPDNGTLEATVARDGPVAEDTLWLSFYHDYYEDGSPRLTEDVAAARGFKLTASKIGLLSDCLYLLPESEVKSSDIGGVPVTIGYRSMPCGPYDPKTHEPSGYYDMYVAEFSLDGIQCQLVTEQMGLEEVVKVAASVITGEREIVVE